MLAIVRCLQARFLAALLVLFACAASTTALETNYFSLVLPESFVQVKEEKNKDGLRGGLYASAGKKKIVILGYVDNEYKGPDRKTFEDVIEELNAEADEGEEGDFFRGVKLEQQDCPCECEAYYREAVIEYKNDSPAWAYQFLFKNENTRIVLSYVDGVSDYQASHAQMADFIEQLKASGL